MGLNIKRAPQQLRGDIVESIWPGDDAVDLERSDLVKWCRNGGKDGLALRDGQKPDVIRWRQLDEFAFGRVSELLAEGSPNLPLVAFRHGIVSIGGVRLMRDRIDDAEGLHDESMRELSEVKAMLPFSHSLRALRDAIGLVDPAEGAASDDVMLTSLPQAIGCHILAATFRARRPAP